MFQCNHLGKTTFSRLICVVKYQQTFFSLYRDLNALGKYT